MRRILFTWRGITVHSYPFMLYLGLLLGIVAGNYAAREAGADRPRVFVATLILLVPALAGARLLFVAEHWRTYRTARARIWRRSEGGAAMYGGLLLAVPVSIPLLRMLQVPFGQFWDVSTFTILTGMIVARVGCLLNGCCSGCASSGPFSMYLPDQHGKWERRIPMQFLEGAWAVLLLAGAIGLWKMMPFAGALFLSTSGAYGAARLVFECMRQREEGHPAIGLQHALSAFFVAASIVAFLVRR